jgi:hypothetical protein
LPCQHYRRRVGIHRRPLLVGEMQIIHQHCGASRRAGYLFSLTAYGRIALTIACSGPGNLSSRAVGTRPRPKTRVRLGRSGAAQILWRVIEPYPSPRQLSGHQLFENGRSGYADEEAHE